MKKTLLSLLLLLTMVLSLAACGGDTVTTTPSGGDTVTPSGDTLAHALTDAGYCFRFPEKASSSAKDAANIVVEAWEETIGRRVDVSDDYVKRNETLPANNYEVLFGTTNRASSKALNAAIVANRANNAKDWQILMKDKEVLIVAGSELGLPEAAKAFAAMLKSPAAQYDLNNYDSGLKIFTWELETLGGKPTGQYKIIIPAGASAYLQTQAKNLQKAVFNKSGHNLEILTDATAKTECEILLGHTNRPTSVSMAEAVAELRNNNHKDYMILGSGTTITLMAGNDDIGTEYAISGFSSMLTGAQKDSISLSKTHKQEGIFDFTIGGVSAGEFQIVTAKNAALDVKYHALRLQEYFLQKTGYAIPVVTDDTPATAHEIVLGPTSRPASTAAATDAYSMAVKNGHLVIDAGHYYGVTKALGVFTAAYGTLTADVAMAKDYSATGTVDLPLTWEDDGSAAALDKKHNIPTKTGVYNLVWNDEFDDIWNTGKVNKNKWETTKRYMDPGDTKYLEDESVLKVENGTATMITDVISADSRVNPVSGCRYKMSTLTTGGTMNFLYGYLEMKAAIPFIGKGEWPSFWATSGSCSLAPRTSKASYSVEVDFFEQFSSTTQVVPNLHKWGGVHNQLSGIDQGAAVSKTRAYTFSSNAEAKKMHTYGFLWSEHIMSFSVDGEFYYSYGLADIHDFGEKSGMDGFRELALDIILNNQIFSEAYGSSNEWGAQYTKKLSDSMFPYHYTVDYMRLYQIDNYGGLWLPKTVK